MNHKRLAFSQAILHAIERRTGGEEGVFFLADMYAEKDRIRADSGSEAMDIRASIRRELQGLRDDGRIQFLDNRGTYMSIFQLTPAAASDYELDARRTIGCSTSCVPRA